MASTLHPIRRRLLGTATALLLSAFAALRADHPLEGSWYLTAFEHEVSSNPAGFDYAPLPFKRVTISETVPGTLRLELRSASNVLLETVERVFNQNGQSYTNDIVDTETTGRERARLAFHVIRDDLVLAQDFGAYFALNDQNIWDAFGFAGVLTREPLPKSNATLWAGPYAGREWITETEYNSNTNTWSLAHETGELDIRIDKTGATYRFTANFDDEEESDSGTLKPSGAFLAIDENESGGTIFSDSFAFGTLVFDRGRYRVVQVSPTELVLLGLSGAVARISPTAGNPFPFNSYTNIDYADSSVVYFQSTANFAFEGQAVAVAAPAGPVSGAFTAKGLPSGVTINPVTGALAGFANAKPGNYAITRTAGAFSDIAYLRILPFPDTLFTNPDVVGTRPAASEYEALLRDPETDIPVAKIELKLAKGGLFTGKLIGGAPKVTPLKGRLAPDAGGEEADSSLTLPDGRTLSVAIDAEGRVFASLDADDTTLGLAQPGEFGGRVRKFNNLNPAPGGQSRGNVAYTVALSPTDADGPNGHGWATASVSPVGNFILKGKLADGRILTGNLRPTTGGYLPYLKPYGGLVDNFLAGRIQLVAREGGGFHHPADEMADLHWNKPAALGSADRIPAFGPVGLDLAIEPWSPIATAEQFAAALGLTDAIAVRIDSEAATNDDPNRALPTSLAVTVAGGKFTSSVAAPVLDESSAIANTRAWARVWKLAVNLKTGTFSGQFTLSDIVSAPTASNPGATKTVTRRVPYSGVLLNGSALTAPGLGHFVVPGVVKTDPSTFGAITLGSPQD